MKENEKEGGGERDVGRTGARGEKVQQRRERLGEGKRRERQREEGRNLPNQEHAILVSLVLYQAENDDSFRRIENLSLMNSLGRKNMEGRVCKISPGPHQWVSMAKNENEKCVLVNALSRAKHREKNGTNIY